MKRKIFCFILVIVAIFNTFLLNSCNQNLNNSQSNPDNIIDFDGTTMNFQSAPLKATAVAPANNELQLVDSYTDGEFNYYLLDAGYIKDAYIEKLGQVRYEGVPISLEISESSYTNVETTLTHIVSNSLSTTHESEVETGIEIGKETWPVRGNFTHTWSDSKTNTTEKSTSNSITVAEEKSQSLTTSVTIGNNVEEHGFYSIVLCGTVDMWVVCKTNKGNTLLESIEINACVRDNCFYSVVYSENSDLNNSPEAKINIDENFYKKLEIPTKFILANTKGQKVYIDTTALSCKFNNNFDHTEPDNNANNIHYSHNFELGKFVVENGYLSSDEKVSLVDEPIDISFRMGYDADALPLQDNMTARFINPYGKTTFKNMPWNLGERNMGAGMLVVLIEYEDGTPDDRICITDALNGKKAGDIIHIATVTKPCKVQIVIAYEVYMSAPGFLGISGEYFMHWRINQLFNIIEE